MYTIGYVGGDMDSCTKAAKTNKLCLRGMFLLLVICVLFIAACKNPASGENNNSSSASKTSLNEKINEANDLFNLLTESSDGTNVLESDYWVISTWELECAIEAAKTIAGKDDATKGEISAALEELIAAYNKFNNAKQPGTKGEDLRKKLNAEIAKAEILAASLKTSVDGSDIRPNEEWVTDDINTRFNNAIARAKTAVGSADTAAAELEAALTELIAAYNEANGAKEKGITPDKDALRAKIIEAGERMNGIHVSNDGSEYMITEFWVSPDVYNTLDNALEAAIFERDNANAAKTEVEDALLALETALNNFNPSAGISEANKKALNDLIDAVTEALDNAVVSVNGLEIYTHVDWVIQQVKDDLQDVLNEADLTAKNKAAPQSEVDNMAKELGIALNTFNSKKQKGKLTSGAIDYIFAGPADEVITLSAAQPLSWKQDDKLHITVMETFDSYKWYVDAIERAAGETSNEIILSAREFSLGTHILTLKVTKNGVPYTKTLKFTVIN
jgi:hypothetical protein